MIAHDPLHRSGRAELPHPAPTLGEDAQAHERIRMTNTSRWKPSRNIAPHAAPRQVVTLAATSQYRPPQVTRRLAKSAQRRAVHGHPVIAEMPQQDRAQVRSLFPNGGVQASPQFFFQSPQLSLPPRALRAFIAPTSRSAPVLCSGTLASRLWPLGPPLTSERLVPAVPRNSLHPLHAPSTPVAVRSVIRHPANLSQVGFTHLVSTTLIFLTTRLRRVYFRSSLGCSPARVYTRAFPPTLTTTALYRSSLDRFGICS
jgi:hypothetical protein